MQRGHKSRGTSLAGSLKEAAFLVPWPKRISLKKLKTGAQGLMGRKQQSHNTLRTTSD